MYLNGFSLLFLLFLFSASMPFVLMLISQIVQIKMPTSEKYTAYESGMTPFGNAKVQFGVKFYLYALLFIVFDIETVFLFPWAVSFHQLGLFALVEMFLFIGILIIGLVYAWKKDALRWQ